MSIIDHTKPKSVFFKLSDYWQFQYMEESNSVAFAVPERHVPSREEFDELVEYVYRFYDAIEIEYGSIDAFNLQLMADAQEKERQRAERYRMNAENKPERDQHGFVYLLHCNGTHKIGKAKKLNDRVLQISPKMPYPVELVHSIESDDYSDLEMVLHERYASKRLNGEWFNLSPEDVRAIKEL